MNAGDTGDDVGDDTGMCEAGDTGDNVGDNDVGDWPAL